MSGTCLQCGHAVSNSAGSDTQTHISTFRQPLQRSDTRDSTDSSRISAYEDEIRQLRADCARLQREKDEWTAATTSPPRSVSKDSKITSPTHMSGLAHAQRPQSVSRLSSLASMIPGRRKTESREGSHSDSALPPLPTPLPPVLGMITSVGSASTPNLMSPIASERLSSISSLPFAIDPGSKTQALAMANLHTSLEAEREMRQKAEASLAQAQTELEELTAQLFGQANEMVATEREARAKLEERVRLLENRDGEKRQRLDRLESAVARIERVRTMVSEPAPPYTDQKDIGLQIRNTDIKVS